MAKFKKSTKNNVKFIDSETLYDRFIDKKSWLVRIHGLVDFEYFRPTLEPLYSDEGREAYDCVFMFKICVLQYLEGGLSDRKVIRHIKTNMEYKYFLGMAIDDEVPYHTKVSDFRLRVGEIKFQELFDTFVEMLSRQNIITPEDKRYMDATHQLADVAKVSVNVLLSQAIKNAVSVLEKYNIPVSQELDIDKKDFLLSDAQKKARFVELVKQAQKYKEMLQELMQKKSNNDIEEALQILSRILKERSRISPSGEIQRKNSDDKGRLASLTDKDATWGSKSKDYQFLGYKTNISVTENGFIDVVSVHSGHEGDESFYQKDAMHSKGKKQVTDQKYGTLKNREWSKENKITLVAPVRKNMKAHLHHQIMEDAFQYSHTDGYKKEIKKRGSLVEGKFGIMKTQHGFSRAKYRTLPRVSIQALLTAIVMNFKALVTWFELARAI